MIVIDDREVIENCQVEWDKRRGVLYVHNKDTGATILRICRIPRTQAKLFNGQIDITGPFDHILLPNEFKV